MEDLDRLSVLLADLRHRLGAQRFALWLGPHTHFAVETGVLRVQSASLTEMQWLRRNVHDILVQCAAAVWRTSMAIVYEVLDPAPAGVEASPEVADASVAEAREEAEHGAALPSHTPLERTPRRTFANFVVGAANNLAAEAAQDAVRRPGRCSPIAFCGPPGVGKSHLLASIDHAARSLRARVLHITAEQFTSHFVEALDRRSLPGFRHKVRSVELLLIDDVQFLTGKKATIAELLHTVDALHARNGQVVLACDRASCELTSVHSDLASRVSAGLTADIEPPDHATRLGIVQSAASRLQIDLAAGVPELVAQHVVGSGRMLCGALNRLVAVSMATRKPISLQLAEPALVDFCRQHVPPVKLADIQRAVCEVFGVESATLRSSRKNRAVAQPRMLAMWLARRYTRAALSEIGEFFGGRSHSTVVSAKRKFDDLLSQGKEIVVANRPCLVEDAIRQIEARLRTG